MKRAILFAAAMAVATPALAQQTTGAAVMPPPAGQARGGQPQAPPVDVPWNDAIPPGTADHIARALKESTRHGEWAKIPLASGTLNSWVVYPERKEKAGVVIVIHDIRGMSDTARAVGDQLAQDGFIAIVPDFVSGMGPDGGGTESLGAGVGKAIQSLSATDALARLNAAMEFGKKLPASNGKTGVVGFCWGGARSFAFAAGQPALNAAVVYYGDAPGSADSTQQAALANLKAPVLGLYAGNDARINMTLPDTQAAMKTLGRSYDVHIFEGSGHGFMGNQAGAGGANLKAAQESWPLALAFFRTHLK